MTKLEYWKQRCEAAESYARLKGNSIDESEPELNARLIWEVLACYDPPAPVSAEGVDEVPDWTRNYLSKKYPSSSKDDMDGDELRLYFGVIVDALNEFTAGSRWRGEQHCKCQQLIKNEPVTFLLSNALRSLTEEQRIALRDALIERTPKQPHPCCARWVDGTPSDDNIYPIKYGSELQFMAAAFYADNKWHINGDMLVLDKHTRVLYLSESPCTCQQELDELRAWKKEALAVMPDFQAIGKELDIPIGQTVHDKILPWIADMKAWKKVVESNYPEMQAIQEELGVKAGKDILPAIHNLKSGQQVVLPTREEAEEWADTSYPGDDIFAISSRNYMMAMYDWISEKINQQK